MPRSSALIGVLAIVVAACGGATAAGSSPVASFGDRPTVDLTIEGGGAAGTWPADPKAPLAVCQHLSDGAWRVQYSAGGPTVDLFVGAHAGEPGHANEFALEIDAHGGYLHMDEAGFRMHDPVGRNHMAVAIRSATAGTTLAVSGTMPYHSGYSDYGQARITLTAACPA
ncbi:MAG TPA: hypothetical protein VGQ31_08100 [Candidatus Limnocylindrales bacterium]|jgi:hypothetical protein|nr:hypothetical protein [Candidatus Limnocylindrales bacterium]